MVMSSIYQIKITDVLKLQYLSSYTNTMSSKFKQTNIKIFKSD